MKKNLNTIDRIVRIVLALVIAILYFNHQINGTLGIALMIAAGIVVLTGFVGFCPIYWSLGWSTKKRTEA